MKIIDTNNLPEERKVRFHAGMSHRLLLKSDGMGYTMTRTFIDAGVRVFQHYKNHLESCLCVSGDAILENAATGEKHRITPGVCYVLDKNDPHFFEAYEPTELICVFNPPLTGREVHQQDGSYAIPEERTGYIDFTGAKICFPM